MIGLLTIISSRCLSEGVEILKLNPKFLKVNPKDPRAIWLDFETWMTLEIKKKNRLNNWYSCLDTEGRTFRYLISVDTAGTGLIQLRTDLVSYITIPFVLTSDSRVVVKGIVRATDLVITPSDEEFLRDLLGPEIELELNGGRI